MNNFFERYKNEARQSYQFLSFFLCIVMATLGFASSCYSFHRYFINKFRFCRYRCNLSAARHENSQFIKIFEVFPKNLSKQSLLPRNIRIIFYSYELFFCADSIYIIIAQIEVSSGKMKFKINLN